MASIISCIFKAWVYASARPGIKLSGRARDPQPGNPVFESPTRQVDRESGVMLWPLLLPGRYTQKFEFLCVGVIPLASDAGGHTHRPSLPPARCVPAYHYAYHYAVYHYWYFMQWSCRQNTWWRARQALNTWTPMPRRGRFKFRLEGRVFWYWNFGNYCVKT